MIDPRFLTLGGTALNAVSSNNPTYGEGYDSSLYQRSDESLGQYLRRMKLQRSGVLGTGAPYPVKPKPLTAEEALDGMLERVTARPSSPVSSGPSENENNLGIPLPSSTTASPFSLEGMVRQMSGQDFDPAMLLSAVPTFGLGLTAVTDALRTSAVEKKLKELGTYNESQISYLLENPKVMMAVLGSDPDLGFEDTIDYEKLRSKGLMDWQLTDIFKGNPTLEDINTGMLSAMGFDPFAIGPLGKESNIMTINPLTGKGTAMIGGIETPYQRILTPTEAEEQALAAKLEQERIAQEQALAAQLAREAEAAKVVPIKGAGAYDPTILQNAGTLVGTENTGMFAPEKISITPVAPSSDVTVNPAPITPITPITTTPTTTTTTPKTVTSIKDANVGDKIITANNKGTGITTATVISTPDSDRGGVVQYSDGTTGYTGGGSQGWSPAK